MLDRATIDFETRSACSLKKCGAWKYSLDPTTEVLCLAFRLPYWEEGRTGFWAPTEEHPTFEFIELHEWIDNGGLIEAHNAFFERAIWTNVVIPRYEWPAIAHDQWRCSAAKAAAHALPRGLDDALEALRLPIRKDAAGGKVMMKMNKPRKPRKAEREAGVTGLLWWDTPELREKLYAYCRQDVLAEEALSNALPPLSDAETEMFHLDAAVNSRGFQLDRDAVTCALALIAKETSRLNQELQGLTNGQVKKATQRAQLQGWLQAEEDLWLPDTTKETIDHTFDHVSLSDRGRQVLTCLRTLGRSSTAKYEAMRNWMGGDGRVRGGLLYHGATTGRWSGSGVQPHNFPRGGKLAKDQDGLWATLKSTEVVCAGGRADCVDSSGTEKGIRRLVPGLDIMAALSDGLRGAITAGPGKVLYVADYAAIEARVVLWLAGAEHALDIFRRGEDIYCTMASEIYGRPITKADATERQVGKTAILGLGYGMGASKFVDTCAAMAGVTIDDEFAQQVVQTYRSQFFEVKELWEDTENAAIAAVRGGGSDRTAYTANVAWRCEPPFLFCELPSGRRLAYPFPEIKARATPWGAVKASLTFMGTNAYSREWTRQTTYGGSLVENITQAVARDIMAEAMLRCEWTGLYQPVLSVHDELIAEAPEGQGSVEEFVALLTEPPDWAPDCPIAAEGWSAFRYHK